MYAMTAAHPTLPIPSYARVTNLASQKSVIVRINDRGPFLHERAIDVSYTAAHKLGIVGTGSGDVEVESIAVNGGAASTVASEPASTRPPENSVPAVITAAPVTVPALAPAVVSTVAPAMAPAPVVTSASDPALLASLESSETRVYLQLGAFKSQEGAESFMERMRGELGRLGKQFKMSAKDGLVRVHIGPYGSQSEARENAEKMSSTLGFKPMVNLP